MKLTIYHLLSLFFIFIIFMNFEPYENYNDEFYKSNKILNPEIPSLHKCNDSVSDKEGTLSAFLDNYKIRKVEQKQRDICNDDPDKESYILGSSPFTQNNINIDEIETSLTDQGELNKDNHYLISPYYFNSNPKYKAGHMDIMKGKKVSNREREVAVDLGERVDKLSIEESDRHQLTSLSPQIWSLWSVTSENRDPR